MDDMVCIGNFRTRMEADMAKAVLEGEGVPSYMTADDAAGYQPFLLMGSGGVGLHVRTSDAERARELLQEVDGDSSRDSNGGERH